MAEGVLIPVKVETSNKSRVLITSECVVGRGEQSTYRINDTALSRKHFKIYYSQENFYIEDLKSKNGTYLNKKKINGPVILNDGDEIIAGKNVFRFEIINKDETMSFDSFKISAEDEKTGSFNSLSAVEDDSRDKKDSELSMSMQLDKFMVEDYLNDEKEFYSKDELKKKKNIFNKTYETFLGIFNSLKNQKPFVLKFGFLPVLNSFLISSFILFFLSSFLISEKIQYTKIKMLKDIYSFTHFGNFLQAVVLSLVMTAVSLFCVFLIFSFVWLFFKDDKLKIKFKNFFGIVLASFVPSIAVLLVGASFSIIFSEGNNILLRVFYLFGNILLILGVVLFYFVFWFFYSKLVAQGKKIIHLQKRFLPYFLMFLFSFFMFYFFIYNIVNWKSNYEKSFDFKSQIKIAKNLIREKNYEKAKAVLVDGLFFLHNLNYVQKADLYFYLGIAEWLNGELEDGKKHLAMAFKYTDKEKKSMYFDVLNSYELNFDFSIGEDNEYEVFDAAYKYQDEVVAAILVDLEKYTNKNIVIKNMYYRDFGFIQSKGIKGLSDWFNADNTYVFNPTELMKSKMFMFYFHPKKDSKESMKFVMTNTGKKIRRVLLTEVKGKFVKADINGRKAYVFLVKEFAMNYKKYYGEAPIRILEKK